MVWNYAFFGVSHSPWNMVVNEQSIYWETENDAHNASLTLYFSLPFFFQVSLHVILVNGLSQPWPPQEAEAI